MTMVDEVGEAPRSLVRELLRSYRMILTVLLVMLVVALGSGGYLLVVSQPALTRQLETTKLARDAHEALLDGESNLRAWLATGDRSFLAGFQADRKESGRALEKLLRSTADDRLAAAAVVDMLLARQHWEEWAEEAAAKRVSSEERVGGELSEFLLRGDRLFTDYARADDRSTSLIRERREAALTHQQVVIELALACVLFVLALTGYLAVRRRRALHDEIVLPIEGLLDRIGSIHDGELARRSECTRVAELDRIATALDELAEGLDGARREAADRERRLAYLAERFETVVRVGREIAGSLSVRYVSAAVGEAAADLLGKPVTLWARTDTGPFEATFRSTDPHGALPPPDLTPSDVVAAAAADARTVVGAQSRAYPLVLAGMVVGVLEAQASEVPQETEQVLDALLSTAAAALESSRLHSAARELAHIDGLTALPNRRRFETDLDSEWERCRRYGRPLALVMLDLDHFKRLNDEYGHLTGDQALRGVADAINQALRTSDSGYRYGGEELALLLRETSLREAVAVAERVRRAVEAVRIDDSAVRVTASLGVAVRRAGMLSPEELVRAADAALYTAKHAGRNRVVADTDQQEATLRVIGEGDRAER